MFDPRSLLTRHFELCSDFPSLINACDMEYIVRGVGIADDLFELKIMIGQAKGIDGFPPTGGVGCMHGRASLSLILGFYMIVASHAEKSS